MNTNFQLSTRSPCAIAMSGTLLALCLAFSGNAAAQSGQIAFDVTESALSGTVSCNGGPATPIASVEASTTDVSGSNEVIGSSLSGNACGLALYSIGSADDSSYANDTTGEDDGGGSSVMSATCLLGGVVCFASKNEVDRCTADRSENVACTETTNGSGLYFAGQHITGTFTAPTTFHATNLRLNLGGSCTGIALFNGTLTLATSTFSVVNGVGEFSAAPLALNGTLQCLGLPLSTMKVDLRDAYDVVIPMQKNGLPTFSTLFKYI